MERPKITQLGIVAGRLLILSAVVAMVTFVCFRVVPVNATTAGFIYLLIILVTGTRWTLFEAVCLSVLSTLCLNFFFLPPIGTLTIADPNNWVALFAFLTTALTASHLSTTAKRRTIEATGRQRDMEQLYRLSRSILLLDSSAKLAQQIATDVAQEFDARAVALYIRESNEVRQAGPEQIEGAEELLRKAANEEIQTWGGEDGVMVAPIRLGARPIGSIALRGIEIPETALHGLANLVAIAIERAKAQQQASKAEAARRSDELKSTLLDAIAHEFKTPLTGIKAATTAVLSDGVTEAGQQRELLNIIDEEADRLSSLVTEAIDMARIEQGTIKLRHDWHSALDLLVAAVKSRGSMLDGRNVVVNADGELPEVSADGNLIGLALRQLIDNAAKYSPPGSAIELSALQRDRNIIFRVRDYGPGIPESDAKLVFERFHRSAATRHKVPGAGLGLAIAKDIAEAHGGSIAVRAAENGVGSLFEIALPLEEEKA